MGICFSTSLWADLLELNDCCWLNNHCSNGIALRFDLSIEEMSITTRKLSLATWLSGSGLNELGCLYIELDS